MHRWAGQVSFRVQQETPNADGAFQQEHSAAQSQKVPRLAREQAADQKSDSQSAGHDRDPLQAVKEAIFSVVSQAENEISHESAQSEKQDPLRPLGSVRIHHAIDQKQEPEPGIGQRSGKWRGISEAANGAFVEKRTVQ